MARRRRSASNERAGRGYQNTTRTDVLPLTDLTLFEDRRDFHPLLDDRPAAVLFDRSARQVVVRRPPMIARSVDELLPNGLQFNDAAEVVVCVRRKRRREVLFAKRWSGRNGGRRYRRNRFSEVSCR